MPDRFAEHLSGKTVIGSDGTELGMLSTISINVTTGALSILLVEPTEETAVDVDVPVDEDGRVHIPITRVQAVNDYIVVAR